MEEKINGEQPCWEENNVQSEIVENIGEGTTCLNPSNGSLGKFKDAQSLLSAYNSLQAEFTRKCQKLNELIKDNSANVAYENSQDTSINESQDESLANNEMGSKLEEKLIFESDDWKEKVSSFLNENTEAKEYSEKIANEIMQDKNLQSSPYCLDLAWARVMKKEYARPDNLANDQNFIREKILSQDQIKMQVIQEYFKELQNKKIPPVIASGGMVAPQKEKQPTSLLEAKQMVEKLFNLKGN